MSKTRVRQNSNQKPERVSNNTGWHIEIVPGEGPKRVSHNPRLAETHPELVAQWHPTRNGSLTPHNVTALSTYRAWWICEFGHEWSRQVHRRAWHGSGCPECKVEGVSLRARYPELVSEWSTKNGDLTPNQVRWSSGKLVWWRCSTKQHDDYQRTVYNRTNKEKPHGCPVCEGQQPERLESFAALYPDIAKEWHPRLNGDLDPYRLTAGSCVPVWWRCRKDKKHEWLSPVFNRTRQPECPYCRLWYVTDENRLSVQFPAIAAEWHPKKNRFLWPHVEGSFKVAFNLRIPKHLRERNRRLRASDVAVNSDEVCWWKCTAKGHEWQASVEARAIKGRKCPACERDKLVTEDSLAALFPAVAKLWHPTRNLPLQPTDVVPGSTQVVYWRCPKLATHVWQAHVYSVVRSWKAGSNGCRWCSGLSADEKNSLASKCPAVAKLWHPTRNGNLLPSEVTFKSNKRVWWHCGKPEHEFDATVANMVAAFEDGANGCKFCAGRAAAPDNCLKRTFPAVAEMWHPTKNGQLSPADVTQGSYKMVIWLCDQGHDWAAKVSCMVQSFRLGSAAKGCPFCDGKRATLENNLQSKYPQAATLWDETGNAPVKPSEVLPRSKKVYYWRCQEKHSWRASVNTIVIAVMAGRVPCLKCRP